MSDEQTPQQTPAASSGLDPKLAALLSYLLGILGGIVFLVIEKDNKYVRFHAAQSIVFTGAWIVLWIVGTILSAILSMILGNILGSLIGLVIGLVYLVLGLGGLILWVVLMIKAFTGYDNNETFKLPFIGGIAENIAGTNK